MTSSTLPLETLMMINRVCDQYEDALTDNQAPQIEHFLTQVDDKDRIHLLSELVVLDLDFQVLKSGISTNQAKEIGKVRSYFERFATERLEAAVRESWLRAEIKSCIRHGAIIDSDQVAQAFPEHARLAQSIPKMIAAVRPIVMRIANQEGRWDLDAIVQLGRQRSNEPPPVSRSETPGESPRIIVAPSHETHISRQHAEVACVAVGRVKIRCLSRESSTYVNGNQRLPKGQSVIMDVPGSLCLGPVTITFAFCESHNSGTCNERT